MYGQKNENGEIINIISVEVEGFDKLPEGAHVGDYVKDGKAYTPPNGYSILSDVKKGEPVWADDIEKLRSATLSAISSAHDEALVNGHFLSEALGIEVDCRRNNTKNDYQNVQGLLSRMTRENIESVTYIGVSESVTATKAQIQALIYEMEDYVNGIYAKKWALEAQIEAATTAEELEKITW